MLKSHYHFPAAPSRRTGARNAVAFWGCRSSSPVSYRSRDMSSSHDRRTFMSATALGLGGLAFLDTLPAVTAAEAKLDPKLVRLDPDIEPLVQLLEETPRDRVLEEVGSRVKKGTPYRDVLAALLL